MRRRSVLFVLCGVVAAFTMGLTAPSVFAQETVHVAIKDFTFEPKTISIEPGTTVVWTNEDVAPHTVTYGNPGNSKADRLFDSGLLFKGDTFSSTFEHEGTFTYYCIPHQHMASMRDAKVVVGDGVGDTPRRARSPNRLRRQGAVTSRAPPEEEMRIFGIFPPKMFTVIASAVMLFMIFTVWFGIVLPSLGIHLIEEWKDHRYWRNKRDG